MGIFDKLKQQAKDKMEQAKGQMDKATEQAKGQMEKAKGKVEDMTKKKENAPTVKGNDEPPKDTPKV